MTKIDYSGNSNSSLDVASNGNRPVPSLRHASLRAARTGQVLVMRAASGAMAQDQAWAGILADRADTETEFVIICDVNDARFLNLSRIDRYKQFLMENALQSVLSVRKYAASSSVTKTGSWSATPVLASRSMMTAAIDASATATVLGDCVYITTLVDNHAVSQGSVAWVYDGSTKIGEINSDNVGVNVGGGNSNNGLRYGPAVFRFSLASAGAHDIQVVNKASKTLHLVSISGNGGQIASPKVVIGNGYAVPDGAMAVPPATTAAFKVAAEDVVSMLQSDGFDVRILDTCSHDFTRMPDKLHWAADDHAWVDEAIEECLNPAAPYSREFPMQNGNTLIVNFDAAGVVTSYTEI